MLDEILKEISDKNIQPKQYSPLNLAYIGDCVYELYVRSFLLKDGSVPMKKIHHMATGFVNAKAQAEFYYKIKDKLTDDEICIFKRGRNANSHVPKNADLNDYKLATGIEALIGYLYLSKENDRIIELMRELVL